jgi:RND family efflux transporter MFP subunit
VNVRRPRGAIRDALWGLFALALGAHAQEAYDCVINPRATIQLGSSEDGVLAEVLVSRGDSVEKGQLVARLESEVERLSAELARLRAESDVEQRSKQAQVEYRTREAERLVGLRESRSVAENLYDEARIERRLAELGLEQAQMDHEITLVEYDRAKAALERRAVRSPVNGVVVDVFMQPGEYVHEQRELMTLAEVDPLNVEVFLPVAAYGTVVKGMRAEVIPEQPVGGVREAEVTVVDSVFDAASRTFGVRLELPNPGYALPAGLRCTVKFGPSTDADGG